jgi:hypothetical protein
MSGEEVSVPCQCKATASVSASVLLTFPARHMPPARRSLREIAAALNGRGIATAREVESGETVRNVLKTGCGLARRPRAGPASRKRF